MIAAYYVFSVITLLLSLWVYLNISKLNDDYFNLYTVKIANFVLIQLIPTMLYFYQNKGELSKFSMWTLVNVSIMVIGNMLMFYIGYKFVFMWNRKSQLFSLVMDSRIFKRIRSIFDKQLSIYSKMDKKLYYVFTIAALLVCFASFYLLAVKGVGLRTWIFNNRHAYQVGRKGTGQYYILFELFLLVSFCFSLGLVKKDLRKLAIVSGIFVVLSYFTGSKYYILGIMLMSLLYFGQYVKKISFKFIALSGITLLIALILLLQLQSNMSLVAYSDYYRNFLTLVEKFYLKFQSHTLGRYGYEEAYWNYIPRSLNPNKPIVYGSIYIPFKFFGETVLQGNYPAFGELALTFVEFGVIGVIAKAFITGITFGIFERVYRYVKANFGYSPIIFVIFAYIGYIYIPNLPRPYFYFILIMGHFVIKLIYSLYKKFEG